jgi:hypothetical protein
LPSIATTGGLNLSEENAVRTLERARPSTTRRGASAARRPSDTLRFQRSCPHPSAKWVCGRSLDYFVCERCRAVLEEGWPDDHPEISRWLNEGGAVGR